MARTNAPSPGNQYFKMGFVKNENLTQEGREKWLKDTFMCFSVRRPILERLSQVFVPLKEEQFLLKAYKNQGMRTISNMGRGKPKHMLLPYHKLHPK